MTQNKASGVNRERLDSGIGWVMCVIEVCEEIGGGAVGVKKKGHVTSKAIEGNVGDTEWSDLG